MTDIFFSLTFVQMKIQLNPFSQALLSESHKEIVLLPSPQLHYYDKVMGKHDWTVVLSIKFIIWEVGLSIVKPTEMINVTKYKKYNEEVTK